MTTTVEPQALPDAGPCRWCSDVQWDHKRGKGGCKVPGCGCDKYLPPKQAAPEPQPVDEPARAGLTDPVETLDVEPRRRREPVGEPAVTDPDAQAESLRQVAEIDEQLASPIVHRPAAPPTLALNEADRLQREVERYKGLATDRLIERDEAQAAAKQAREALTDLRRALAEQEAHAARQLGARSAELAQVRAELERVNAARQRAQEQLGQAVHSGLAAATRVLWRYDADHCETCGFRTTVPGMNHAHPLKPVTVLVVERDPAEATAPADDNPKEQ